MNHNRNCLGFKVFLNLNYYTWFYTDDGNTTWKIFTIRFFSSPLIRTTNNKVPYPINDNGLRVTNFLWKKDYTYTLWRKPQSPYVIIDSKRKITPKTTEVSKFKKIYIVHKNRLARTIQEMFIPTFINIPPTEVFHYSEVSFGRGVPRKGRFIPSLTSH